MQKGLLYRNTAVRGDDCFCSEIAAGDIGRIFDAFCLTGFTVDDEEAIYTGVIVKVDESTIFYFI